MKGFKRGEKGFTLIELLIVVAILGILAAVVIPNVVGLLGRGGAQAFETDEEVLQLAAATFYSDTHEGWYDTGTPTWGASDTDLTTAGHYYPTAIAQVSNHVLTLSTTSFDSDNVNNPVIVGADGNATDAEIQSHAIWMGLLVNARGTYDTLAGTTERWEVSPRNGENGLYLNEMPQSAMDDDLYNGDSGATGGGYCWVVGANGFVFGAYQIDTDEWYSGFSGAYP